MTHISEKMQSAMNQQIVEELHSGYIYLGISRWAAKRSMKGYAAWMKKQAKEEFEHAERFMEFITDTGGKVELGSIDAVSTDYADTEATIQAAITHEEYITKKIHDLLSLAHELREYPAVQMLQWYVAEQVEEEANANALMDLYVLNGRKDGLFDHRVKRD